MPRFNRPVRIAKYFISYPSKRLISGQVRARSRSRCTRVCAPSMTTIRRMHELFLSLSLSLFSLLSSLAMLRAVESILVPFVQRSNLSFDFLEPLFFPFFRKSSRAEKCRCRQPAGKSFRNREMFDKSQA